MITQDGRDAPTLVFIRTEGAVQYLGNRRVAFTGLLHLVSFLELILRENSFTPTASSSVRLPTDPIYNTSQFRFSLGRITSCVCLSQDLQRGSLADVIFVTGLRQTYQEFISLTSWDESMRVNLDITWSATAIAFATAPIHNLFQFRFSLWWMAVF